MKASNNFNVNRYDWAKATIKKLNIGTKQRVLYDIGSRDGILQGYCNESEVKYYGFDLEPLEDRIQQWNIENKFPYSSPKANLITFLEVIEHLNNPWLSIKNLNSVLEMGGYFLITTPNPLWSDSRLNQLFSGYLSCFTQSDLDLNHHVFIPWPHIIEKLLNDNGFEVVECITIDGETQLWRDYKISYKIPIQFGYRLLKKIIEYKNPSAKGMSYALIAKKVRETS